MRAFFLIIIIISYTVQAETEVKCKSRLNLTLENGTKEVFCSFEDKLISLGCFKEGIQCKLIKDLKLIKTKTFKDEPITHSTYQNPGSWACKQLNWKVLMGKMYDSSQVCVCQHPFGSSIICTSLIE